LGARRILLGVVGRPHGVRGLVRVHAYAADPADLARYGTLSDERGRQFTLRWRGEGIAELTEIVDGRKVPVADRTAAEKLTNLRLYVDRDRLPPPGEDEFYLADLIGLIAVTPEGRELGRVATVHDYGAGASLEIGALLVPFTRAAVPEVDLAAGRVTVVPPAVVEARPPQVQEASA
jgi:16S rRNA processing protein RimM